MRLLILLLCLTCVPLRAHAFSEDDNGDGTTRTLSDYIGQYVDVPKGATDWKLFGKTKEIDVEGRDKDGMDYGYTKPAFAPEVEALGGKSVTVKGFMFPLDPDEKQQEFLIGPFPISCPYHYHVGPSLVIEVHTDKEKPVKFSYDPVTVSGTLELVKSDPDNSVFYRLNHAVLVN